MSSIEYSRFDGIGDTSSDDSDDGRDQREGEEVSPKTGRAPSAEKERRATVADLLAAQAKVFAAQSAQSELSEMERAQMNANHALSLSTEQHKIEFEVGYPDRLSPYENIYEEERRTSTLPEETMNERGGLPLANRAPTNGTYGIWGHVLPDLLLHTVYYLPAKNEIHLGIDT